jgi:4-amino-4-deoxy-L-arabinose transferase-like glycosyltransferase
MPSTEVKRAGLIAIALLALRLAIVLTWCAPAGDGMQYHQLSQELTRDHRFAFGPPPRPLTYSRMPGYPLFLAAVVHQAPLGVGEHVRRAVLFNLPLDLGTAILIFLIVRRFTDARRATAAMAAALLTPLLVLLSCYALSETLATFLATLELALVLLARDKLVRAALAAGVVAGLAQLVRADALVVAPGVALAIWLAPHPVALRLRALGAFALAAAVVFSPWPIRNLVQFGQPHPAAVSWRGLDGTPLPDGHVAWERTWAASRPGDSYIDLAFTAQLPLDEKRTLYPRMYDDDAEKARLIALFQKYDREHFSPAVDDEFRAIAADRTRRHPLRTLVALPLERMARLYFPVAEWELPFRVGWLGFPTARPLFGVLDILVYLAALVGGVLLFRRGEKKLLAILGVCIGARMAIYAFAIPSAVTERYLVEAMPLFLILAFVGLRRRSVE